MSLRRREIQRAIEESLTGGDDRLSWPEIARVRLARWGGALRHIILSLGPRRYPTGCWPQAREIVDFEREGRRIDRGVNWDEALETDALLEWLRQVQPTTYTAVCIRFVEREPGGRTLSYEEQVRRYNKATGLGRSSYYDRIAQAIEHVADVLKERNEASP